MVGGSFLFLYINETFKNVFLGCLYSPCFFQVSSLIPPSFLFFFLPSCFPFYLLVLISVFHTGEPPPMSGDLHRLRHERAK